MFYNTYQNIINNYIKCLVLLTFPICIQLLRSILSTPFVRDLQGGLGTELQLYIIPNVNRILNVASVGFCHRTSFSSGASVHAEIDALDNLKKNFKNTKKNISLIVVRVSFRHDGSHNYANSKPCADCISKMQTIAYAKGYRIKNIFYSNENGDIVRTRLNCLLDDVSKYVSRYYRRLIK
jgi:hypothetical protein